MSPATTLRACLRCERPMSPVKARTIDPASGAVPHGGRGLCAACRQWLARHDPDTLLDYPKGGRPSEEVLAEYELLKRRDPGLLQRHVAEMLGMTYKTFNRSLTRARKQRRELAASGQG
jgi:hypothetical protein